MSIVYAATDALMGLLAHEALRLPIYLVGGFVALWLMECAWALLFNALGAKPRS